MCEGMCRCNYLTLERGWGTFEAFHESLVTPLVCTAGGTVSEGWGTLSSEGADVSGELDSPPPVAGYIRCQVE